MTASVFGFFPSIDSSFGRALGLPIAANASTALSRTHQSSSSVALIRCSTADSSFVALRISIAVRRISSSLSLINATTALTTLGPPISASASPARDRTHQSSSLRTLSKSLTESTSPSSLSTSTAARREYSDSSFSASARYLTVSGCFIWIIMSTALLCTSRSGSTSNLLTASIRTLPGRFASAVSAALRTILLGSLS